MAKREIRQGYFSPPSELHRPLPLPRLSLDLQSSLSVSQANLGDASLSAPALQPHSIVSMGSYYLVLMGFVLNHWL